MDSPLNWLLKRSWTSKAEHQNGTISVYKYLKNSRGPNATVCEGLSLLDLISQVQMFSLQVLSQGNRSLLPQKSRLILLQTLSWLWWDGWFGGNGFLEMVVLESPDCVSHVGTLSGKKQFLTNSTHHSRNVQVNWREGHSLYYILTLLRIWNLTVTDLHNTCLHVLVSRWLTLLFLSVWLCLKKKNKESAPATESNPQPFCDAAAASTTQPPCHPFLRLSLRRNTVYQIYINLSNGVTSSWSALMWSKGTVEQSEKRECWQHLGGPTWVLGPTVAGW